jgi:uncharacterized protein
MNLNRPPISRRKFLLGLGCAGAGAGGYMRFWEPHRLELGNYQVRTNTGGRPIRILHLSDFHASPVVSLDQIAEAIDLGLSQKPDLICLTGDFITSKYDRFDEYGRILKRLTDYAPAFACVGNHDGGRWSARWGYADHSKVDTLLAKSGISLLHNAATEIRVNQRKLLIAGVGDLWARELDPARAFSDISRSQDATVLLLSHNPDSKSELVRYPWDVMLCGHTHGGQLYLPILGAPFAPVRDKRFVMGLHRWRDKWIYITRGVGNIHGMRLNCPPEVSLLNLV